MGPISKVGKMQVEGVGMKNSVFSYIYPAGKAKNKAGKG